MIVFDLKCSPGGHVFEAWFGSSEDYDSQKARGLVQCPLCGTGSVEKAAMAPHLAKGDGKAAQDEQYVTDGATAKAMLAAMAAIQKKMLQESDYVGDRFADEARAIHLGEAAARAIYGKADEAETESLREDGIAVMPLLFPVLPPGEEN